MTTSARLLTLLSLMLALGACAVQQAGAADGGQAAQPGGAAAVQAAPAATAAPSAMPHAAAPAGTPSSSGPAPAAQPRDQMPATRVPAASMRAGAASAAAPSAAAAAAAAAAPAAAPAAPLSGIPVQDTPAAQPVPGIASAPSAPSTAAMPGTMPPPAAAGPVAMPAGTPTGSLLQTMLALAAVLAVLAALAWFLKRYGPKAGIGGANLRIVGSLSLGGRERLLVVEVGNQWIVVGASPGRVNALATMPRQDGAGGAEPGAPGAALAAHGPAANSFADWLKQTIDKRK
jgi:flagellar protein FliO/FliZ